jgi:hypothetical protein
MLRSRDPHLAEQLSAMARDQHGIADILNARTASDDALDNAAIVGTLPAQIEKEINNYCQLIKDETSQLTISAPGRTVNIPIETGLVHGRLKELEQDSKDPHEEAGSPLQCEPPPTNLRGGQPRQIRVPSRLS